MDHAEHKPVAREATFEPTSVQRTALTAISRDVIIAAEPSLQFTGELLGQGAVAWSKPLHGGG